MAVADMVVGVMAAEATSVVAADILAAAFTAVVLAVDRWASRAAVSAAGWVDSEAPASVACGAGSAARQWRCVARTPAGLADTAVMAGGDVGFTAAVLVTAAVSTVTDIRDLATGWGMDSGRRCCMDSGVTAGMDMADTAWVDMGATVDMEWPATADTVAVVPERVAVTDTAAAMADTRWAMPRE